MWIILTYDRTVALWHSAQEKPRAKAEWEGTEPAPWVCSIGCCKRSDLAGTGWSNGLVRLWHVRPRGLVPIKDIWIEGGGFVNGVDFGDSGNRMAVAVGQEHRLGRWTRQKSAKNAIYLVDLEKGCEEQKDEVEQETEQEKDTLRNNRV